MGEQGQLGTHYFVADPQTTNPISVEVPVAYAGGRLVFVDLCSDLPGSETLANCFRRYSNAYAGADLLVLRGADWHFADRIEETVEVRSQVSDGQQILCLVGNTESGEGPAVIRPSWAPPVSDEPSLVDLRAIEMHGLLLGRRAIMETATGHYEVGSGAHVRRYIRLRNALESPRDCRRICDWILPSIPDGSQVMVAHRGLGVLEATLEACLGRRSERKAEVHRLPRYDESETGDPHVPVSMKPDESRGQVVVIGVDTRTGDPSSPGGEREKALNRYGFAGATKVCLVDTTFPDRATEAFAHVPVERQHASDCQYCDDAAAEWGLSKIDVDDEIPEPLEKRRTQVKVNMAGMGEGMELWRLIDKVGAATIHVDERYEHPGAKVTQRHRAVDIDVGKLLDNPKFRAECQQELSQAQAEDCLVLISDHENAQALKALAEAALPYPDTSVHIVPRLDPAGAVGALLAASDRILLLDDMIASGATMGWLADRLKFQLGAARFAEIELSGFVILDCSPSEEELKAVRCHFTSGSTGQARFAAYKRVPLPHPDDRCPWCEERKRLQDQSLPELQDARSAYFASRISELEETPLRQISPVRSASTQVLGSFIGNISAETAFVRWASAVQSKRAEVQVPGEGHPPSYYFDAGFVVSHWQDWSQCGGILRTASESELRYTSQEQDFERKWQERSSDMDLAKLAEFGWAALDGKLTAPSVSLVMKTLEERAEEDDAIAAFAAMLAPARTQLSGQ
jgi:hypothetical protein